MALRKYCIVGLSGTTNSGKSTLASMLRDNIPKASTMCQDAYFHGPDDPRVRRDEDGNQNWEDLHALDMEKMMEDVYSWIDKQQHNTEQRYLIIEGFLIFNHRQLAKLIDKKFFIKVDKETCASRRSKRTYIPPDYPSYFENIVWPMYLKNLEAIQDQTDIDYIDETQDLSKVFDYLQKAILET